jgi:hypothetical protein
MACVGLFGLLTGCGRGPRLVAVSGTVSLDGKPLADATVQFEYSELPRSAVGRTDSSGRFTMSYHNRAGAPVGSCKVHVRKQAGGTGGIMSEIVPPRYNTKTQIAIEVTKAEEFPFELTSDRGGPSGAVESGADAADGEVSDEESDGESGDRPPRENNRSKGQPSQEDDGLEESEEDG